MESAGSPIRSRHVTGVRPPAEYPPGTFVFIVYSLSLLKDHFLNLSHGVGL